MLQRQTKKIYTVLSAPLFSIFLTAVSSAQMPQSLPSTSVFINELHYDNIGSDVDEFIEVAGPAGTNLTGWLIVLYNGHDDKLYATKELSGIIPDAGQGFGMVSVNHVGIQNGTPAPDGLALIDAGGTVVQFLSYEGTMTAEDGPAVGIGSVDIGVEESDDTTSVGDSLQLTGTGRFYEDFTWASPAAATQDDPNDDQVFVAVVPEPANHPADFTAIANSDSKIISSWTDSEAGAQAPKAYLLLCSTSASFMEPIDGISRSDDTDCADGNGVKNIAHGSGAAYTWTNLTDNTVYHFKIFPYTNSGSDIDYKTDGVPPTTTATTTARSSSGYLPSFLLLGR